MLTVGFLAAPGRVSAAQQVSCVDQATSEVEALAIAAACDRAVVVGASVSELAQVTAQPDGRLMFESAVVPQRARRADGRWADVDLNLIKGTDGLYRPTTSVADVAFSVGGSGPLVTLQRGGKTLTMSWRGPALPTPVVSGDSLTYQEVMAGVDLVVRATSTGFTHVFVIKTATAAANPAMRQIRFGLGGDARVQAGPDGALRAMAGGTVLASADPAVMWDSRVGADDGAALQSSSESHSTAEAAGDSARVAAVDTQLSDQDLVLRPDSRMLDAPDAAYPIYVDPAWSVYKSRWAYATNNNSTNTDYSTARVGLNPDTGALYRSFFEFPTTANGVSLKGKHIQSAYVQMKLQHSWSCTNTVASMYLTPAINATMKASWSSMSLKTFLDDASGHANKAGGCSNSPQPDMIMNFSGSSVTSQVQTAATGNWNTIAVGFTARAANGSGESTQSRWKKFLPNNAKLIVDYDTRPGAPHSLQVAGVACGTGVLTVGTLSPTFSAVFPDADPGDSLTAAFEWIEVPSGGMSTVTATYPTRRTPPPAKTGISPNTRTTSAAVPIVGDKVYAFRAKSTDKAPYSLTSAWSPWCQFKADTTAPKVSVSAISLPSGPGQPGTFKIESPDSDVTTFKYGWGTATKTVAASGTPKQATVTLMAPSFGRNVLQVAAVDATLNEGVGSIEFTVGRPSPAVARWGLETYPGIDQTAALADQQPALAGDTPLASTDITWLADSRMIGGQTAAFNGYSSALQTSTKVIDTTKSFSVAAWVKLTARDFSDTLRTVVTQEPGPDGSMFYLWSCTSGSWCFQLRKSSPDATDEATWDWPGAYSDHPIEVGVWTHLAGVYNATEKSLAMYVNGIRQGYGAQGVEMGDATGPLLVGKSDWGQHFQGEIADVQVFDRVLVADDFTGRLASDPESGGFNEPGILSPIQVGSWDFEAATPCYFADLRDTCEAPDTVTAWDRWLALTPGAAIGAGQSGSGSGLWLDNQYFPEDDLSGTTQEYGRSAIKTGVTPPDSEGNEYTLWQDTPVLRTDDSFTMSAWVSLDNLNGPHTLLSQRGVHESAAWIRYSPDLGKWQFLIGVEDVTGSLPVGVTSTSSPESGVWTHLAGVYDAGRNQIRLYVNGVLEASLNLWFTPMASTGPLLVGHAFWRDQLVDQWIGAIDDVAVFLGALSDASVFVLYNSQVPATPGANFLARGEVLTEGEYLRSDIGNYQLLMQSDGNLVLYQAGFALWETGTSGNPGAYVIFQSDGNLVVHASDGVPLWGTETWQTDASQLVLRDDGDLVLIGSNGHVYWRR